LQCVAVCHEIFLPFNALATANGVPRDNARVCRELVFLVCCIVLQCAAVCCRVLQGVAVCCGVLQSVAVCCRVSRNLPVLVCSSDNEWNGVLRADERVCRESFLVVRCSVLQRVAVSCSVLQCVKNFS